METFHKLFGSLLSFVYHCFERVVILAYLPLLTREENIVHFFRDVNGVWPITQDALRERTNRYRSWVDDYADQHNWCSPDFVDTVKSHAALCRAARSNSAGLR